VIGWTDLTSDRVRESLDALRSGRRREPVGIRHLIQGEPDPRYRDHLGSSSPLAHVAGDTRFGPSGSKPGKR